MFINYIPTLQSPMTWHMTGHLLREHGGGDSLAGGWSWPNSEGKIWMHCSWPCHTCWFKPGKVDLANQVSITFITINRWVFLDSFALLIFKSSKALDLGTLMDSRQTDHHRQYSPISSSQHRKENISPRNAKCCVNWRPILLVSFLKSQQENSYYWWVLQMLISSTYSG